MDPKAKNQSPLPLIVKAGAVEGSALPYREWLARFFPSVASKPLAARHETLWEWLERLQPGTRPRPRVEVWPRGGAKSSTGELGVARVGAKLSRRFVLYIGDTQEQADKHVQSIASLFEKLGVERAINKYGTSKGWRRDQLRTANGFNVAALGLDTAARGIKLDEFRPDFMLFDDIDSQFDSVKTIDKKKDLIRNAILPAGSSDCAVLFLQNKIHEDSIVSQLCDGRADFLLDREPPVVEAAIVGLQTEIVENEDGSKRYKITDGVPTWAGQGITECEDLIALIGIKSFLRESQHEVEGADGYFFQTSKINYIDPSDVPNLIGICLAADLAATEGGGDHTVIWVLGKAANDTYYVLAAIRGQWSSDRVKTALSMATAHYRGLYPKLIVRLPQDPGQAGKGQASDMRRDLRPEEGSGPTVLPVTGRKSTRATGFSEQLNLGNYYFVKQDLPEFVTLRTPATDNRPLCLETGYSHWHTAVRAVLKGFREDVTDQQDDDVDAGSDAHNMLAARRVARAA